MEIDVRGRPILPRWPLSSGILPFLFTSGVLVRWLTMGLLLVGCFFVGWSYQADWLGRHWRAALRAMAGP